MSEHHNTLLQINLSANTGSTGKIAEQIGRKAQNEGWGAVANESMSCGCILVGSDEIGSVPYLLEEEKTGLVFRSRELESLTNKVKWLLDNRFVYPKYQIEALKTINNIWSPYKQHIIYLC